jgi:hypothetical protein
MVATGKASAIFDHRAAVASRKVGECLRSCSENRPENTRKKAHSAFSANHFLRSFQTSAWRRGPSPVPASLWQRLVNSRGLLGVSIGVMAFVCIGINTFASSGIIYCSLFLFPSALFSHSTSLTLFVLMIMAIAGVISGGIIYLVWRIRQVTFSPRFLRLTFVPAAVTALVMSVALCLLLFQILSIDLHVNERGLELLRVPLLNIIVGCVALPTIVACFSLWHGFKARQELMVLV